MTLNKTFFFTLFISRNRFSIRRQLHILCRVGMYNLLISSIFGPALSDRKSDEKRDAVINVVREKKRVFLSHFWLVFDDIDEIMDCQTESDKQQKETCGWISSELIEEYSRV